MSINTDTKRDRIGYIRYMKREHWVFLLSVLLLQAVSNEMCGYPDKGFHSDQELLYLRSQEDNHLNKSS